MIRVSRLIAVCLFMILSAFRTNAVISIPGNSVHSNTIQPGNASEEAASAPDLGDSSTLLEDPIDMSLPKEDTRLGDSSSLSSSNESIAEDPTHAETYDSLYQRAVKHYLDEEWHQCAGYSQMAIKDYHWYTDTLTACRRDCKAEAEGATPLTEPRDTTQIFFETSVRNALCLLKCRRTHFGSRREHVAPTNVDRDFEMMKPYDYLQLCLFKLGRFQEAASAAVTVLARQPDHTIMANNLRQYIDDYSADPDLLENLELLEYAREYVRGDRAHSDEDFVKSVEHMEAALTAYWRALEDCRLMCEEPFDQGWFPDFVSSVANHFTFTFRCKRKCPAKLSNLYGEEIENFLPSIFNYLQYGYHKLENIPAACGAVESFLELVPTDTVMLKNKQFYHGEYQKASRHFIPRKEVVAHSARERYEEALLNFIDTEFVFLEDDKEIQLRKEEEEEAGPSAQGDHGALRPRTVREVRQELGREARAVTQREMKEEKKTSRRRVPEVILKEQQLNGTRRYVADGLMSDLKCKILSMLTLVAAQDGDGYQQSVNPHTPSEEFHGLTLSRAGLMVHAKLIEPDVVRLVLNVTEKARDHIVEYFGLQKPLYFSYTHLVCRTAKPEFYGDREPGDLSHTVHVDNCIFQGRTELCLRRPPAYTFRDYSAIMYLNQDFDGGEFIFTDDITGQNFQSIVQPKCGRMVAFSSGPENPHGVLPVLRGSRCALALWFTHEKRHQEKDRILAETLLQKIDAGEISVK